MFTPTEQVKPMDIDEARNYQLSLLAPILSNMKGHPVGPLLGLIGCPVRVDAPIEVAERLINLQTYLTNVTADVWQMGMIEKLEEIERILNGEADPLLIKTIIQRLIDVWLHNAYAHQKIISENIAELEKLI